ncbi:MAG: hypothetical protein CMI31_11465 [Opitutae bacterium]|nr:hypothetical protein [Opitutae bacterium]
MTLLHRYLLRDVLSATAVVFLLFSFVLFYGNVVRHDEYFLKALFLSVETFLLLSGLLFPYVLAYALPLGLMAGVLLSFGRLSADREFVAMQASGLSLNRIASPVFLLALLSTGLCLAVNLSWGPQARAAFELKKQSLFFDNLDAFLTAEKQLEFAAASENPENSPFGQAVSKYVLSVGNGKDGVWNNLRVWFVNKEQETLGVLFAETGEIRFEKKGSLLWLNLRNADYQWFDSGGQGSSSGDTGFVAFRGHEPIALHLQGGSAYDSLKHKTISQLLDIRSDVMARGEDPLQVNLRIQRNCSMAFAPLSLAFLAIPLALRVGRRETMFNAGLSLSLSLVYFFLLTALPEWLQSSPEIRPDLLVWAPNVIFQGIGLMLFRSVEHG